MKIIIFLSVAVAYVFGAPQHPRVVGGEDAERNEFPYQISLQWSPIAGFLFQHVCGGSILNEEWILTAGHCVTELPMQGSLRIKAGLLKLDDEENVQTIDVVERIVHPDYEGGVNANDIALLKLKTKLVLNEAVKKISLPDADSTPSGESVLSGWGSTSSGWLPSMPTTLQKVKLPVLAYTDCEKAIKDSNNGESGPLNETSNVCTGPLSGGLSACSGDSGGPLVQNGVQIGIVSWGFMPCGQRNAPSVYTRVSSFLDFINKNVN